MRLKEEEIEEEGWEAIGMRESVWSVEGEFEEGIEWFLGEWDTLKVLC